MLKEQTRCVQVASKAHISAVDRRGACQPRNSLRGSADRQLQILCWHDGVRVEPLIAGHSARRVVSICLHPVKFCTCFVHDACMSWMHMRSYHHCHSRLDEELCKTLQVYSSLLEVPCIKAVPAAACPALEGSAHTHGWPLCSYCPPEVYVK